MAEASQIPYKVDIYPSYGSDGNRFAAHRRGFARGADSGRCVDASHNYERTHSEALLATSQWILAYLLAE